MSESDTSGSERGTEYGGGFIPDGTKVRAVVDGEEITGRVEGGGSDGGLSESQRYFLIDGQKVYQEAISQIIEIPSPDDSEDAEYIRELTEHHGLTQRSLHTDSDPDDAHQIGGGGN